MYELFLGSDQGLRGQQYDVFFFFIIIIPSHEGKINLFQGLQHAYVVGRQETCIVPPSFPSGTTKASGNNPPPSWNMKTHFDLVFSNRELGDTVLSSLLV